MQYNNIKNLIAKGLISEAIKELREKIEENEFPQSEEVSLQSGRLNRCLNELRKGIVSSQEANLVINQVTDGLLKIIKELEEYEMSGSHHTTQRNITQGDIIHGDKVMGDKIRGNKIIINKK